MAMRLVVVIGSHVGSNYFPPSGNIQSSNVLDAIKELDAEKAKRQFFANFSQADLTVNSVFVVNHNLGLIPGNVTVWDDSSEQIYPNKILTQGDNYVSIDLSSFTPLQGTYKVVISE